MSRLSEFLARPMTHDVVHVCRRCGRPYPPNPPVPTLHDVIKRYPKAKADHLTCPECGHRGCKLTFCGKGCLYVGEERVEGEDGQ